MRICDHSGWGLPVAAMQINGNSWRIPRNPRSEWPQRTRVRVMQAPSRPLPFHPHLCFSGLVPKVLLNYLQVPDNHGQLDCRSYAIFVGRQLTWLTAAVSRRVQQRSV